MTITPIVLLSLCSFIAAFGLTYQLFRLAPKLQLLQHANARSSHSKPTATGGGVSFAFIGLMIGFAFCFMQPKMLPYMLFAALLTIVGLLDDLFEVRALWRFAIQFLSTIVLFWSVGTIDFAVSLLGPGLFFFALLGCLLAAIWWLNLVNFMDGIDGLVATQSAAIMFCAVLLGPIVFGTPMGIFELWGVIVASAVLGFLMLNFPPARIFMGDAGSYFIAAAMLAMFLFSSSQTPHVIVAWLLLAAPLVCDATGTLVVRFLQREKWYAPHRQHLYQKLSRRWSSHRLATLAYLAATLFIMLPLAVLSILLPEVAVILLLVTYSVGMAFVIILGAGRPEHA